MTIQTTKKETVRLEKEIEFFRAMDNVKFIECAEDAEFIQYYIGYDPEWKEEMELKVIENIDGSHSVYSRFPVEGFTIDQEIEGVTDEYIKTGYIPVKVKAEYLG